MNRWMRTALFAVFTISFLISAPLVVLYTAGYRYQLGSNHVVKAGVLSITSTPKAATITLDNTPNTKHTPAVIDNLFPGDVHIELSKPGYTSYEKILPILSNESTFIPNAILFLTGTPEQSLDQLPFAAVTSFDKTKFAYVTIDKGTLTLSIRDSTFLQDRSLFTESSHASSTYSVAWSPDGQYLLLKETAGSKETFTLLNVREATTISLPSTAATDVHFDVGSDHRVLYRVGKAWNVFGIDSDVGIPKKLTVDDVRHRNNRLIVVQSADQSVVSYLDDNGVASIIAYLPLGAYQFVSAPSPFIALEETLHHRLILINPDVQDPLRLNEDAKFFEWSEKDDRLLLSDGFDAKIFTASSGRMETITRFSEPLTGIAWYPIGDEILFSQGTTLNALELDDRDARNEIPLVEGFAINSFWVTRDGSKLYFTGSKSSEPLNLFERKLQK